MQLTLNDLRSWYGVVNHHKALYIDGYSTENLVEIEAKTLSLRNHTRSNMLSKNSGRLFKILKFAVRDGDIKFRVKQWSCSCTVWP